MGLWTRGLPSPHGRTCRRNPLADVAGSFADGASRPRHASTIRRIRSVSVKEILAVTARRHGVRVSRYAAFRSQAAGRDMAVWLFRRWTGATLSPPGRSSGLKAIDSVSNLVRRAEKRSRQSAAWPKNSERD